MTLNKLMISIILSITIAIWSGSFWIGLFSYVFFIAFFSCPEPTHQSERPAILSLLLMAIGISWLFGGDDEL